MNRIYHSPATFAFCDRPLTVQAVLPHEEDELIPLFLEYQLTGKDATDRSGELRLFPTDGIPEGDGYTVYSVTLPAAVLADATMLTYCFVRDGIRGEDYTVPLHTPAKWPPFIVTEHFPWGGGPVQCMELYNPGSETVDLYEYELIIPGEDGSVSKRNPLADAPGIHLLPPYEMGVLNFIASGVRKELEARAGEAEPILSYLAQKYPETCDDIADRNVRWMQVDLSYQNEKGEWHTKEGCFSIYHWLGAKEFMVVPRGGGVADAVYNMSVNPDKSHLHVRKFRSSLWSVDPRDPAVAVCTHSRVMPTPGFVDTEQFLPVQNGTTVPAILPLEPSGRVYLADGDCRITFVAVGSRIAAPTVYVKIDEKFIPFVAYPDKDGVYAAVIPYAVLSRMQGKLFYYITVSGELYTATFGAPAAPCMRRISDNAGPAILRTYPAEGQVLEKEQTPEIALAYYDVSGVNLRTSILCVDGRNVSAAAKWTADGVTYLPEKPLALGNHTFEVSLRDALGNRTYRKIAFGICDGTEMNCYRGEVHCHTLESDGLGTPEEAMTYARDVGKVDYFAVTDHSHYLTLEEMRAQRQVADTFNVNGAYATMHGFEMTWNYTSGFWGHMNVLNTDWLTPYHEDIDLYKFYDMLVADKEAIGMFNHPCDAWGIFDDFEGYTPERDEKMCLAEIRGGGFDRGYTLMLSKGWHAAPVANEDNHSDNWTMATPSTGYVLAPSLTRENVLDAFCRRRTYTTYDNTMKIFYRVNGEWMGSRLQAPEKLLADIEIHTESENGIGMLSLVTEDNIVVARIDAGPLCDFTWQVELDPDFDYYYLRVNNGNLYSVTSPVFVEGRNLLNITDLQYGVCHEEGNKPHVVEATVQNAGDKSMKDVTVDFYLSPLGGFELRTRTPFATVHIGKLEAGEARTVSRRFPTVPGNRRVTVIVSGYRSGERYADTAYRLITPVRFSRQVPMTSPVTVEGEEIKNPFRYVELYNPMPHTVALNEYTIKLWHASGVAPAPERCLALDGYSIPAGGTLTVWVRPAGAPLTVEDFNTHYDTSLVEGQDLVITENRILTTNTGGHMLDLVFRKEVVSRVTFGKYCVVESDMAENLPLYYGDFTSMTARQARLHPENGEIALRPGGVLPRQIPAAKQVVYRNEEHKDAEKSIKKSIITRLSQAPLVPLQAARLVVSAVTALKSIFGSNKE